MADLLVTPANVIAGSDAEVEHGKAGATITAGQQVYRDATTRKYLLADSNAVASAGRKPRGTALNGASDNQHLAILKGGDVTIGATLTPGVAYMLSDTPGGIGPVADVGSGENYVQIGLAKSASVLHVDYQDSGVTA